MSHELKISVIGLGYIGLPTSALMASKGMLVAGTDVNASIVNRVNVGKVHISEPGLGEAVSHAVHSGKLTASTIVSPSDIYLIVVPTPFKENNEPDISYVEKAATSILPHLKSGDLLIIESTCPIGTTEHISRLIVNNRPELDHQISIAYCPERVLPGNVMYELEHNDRVIGGLTDEATIKAKSFYRTFVSGELHGTHARTAEMCKLVENSSRDVSIAFANELSIICEKAGINVWELIKLANKHPRVEILSPGCGVGGHCIAVDPYFITAHFPLESQIIGQARKINNYKTFWCIEKIKNVIIQFRSDNDRNPIVGLMGLSFKPNIDDLRESPADYIAKRLVQEYADSQFRIVEPHIDIHETLSLCSIEDAVDDSDILIFLVAHDEFRSIKCDGSIIIDFCGIQNTNSLRE